MAHIGFHIGGLILGNCLSGQSIDKAMVVSKVVTHELEMTLARWSELDIYTKSPCIAGLSNSLPGTPILHLHTSVSVGVQNPAKP